MDSEQLVLIKEPLLIQQHFTQCRLEKPFGEINAFVI